MSVLKKTLALLEPRFSLTFIHVFTNWMFYLINTPNCFFSGRLTENVVFNSWVRASVPPVTEGTEICK